MRLNLNDRVKIKLRPEGEEPYVRSWTDLGMPKPHVPDDKVLKMPLWEVAGIFGSRMHMGFSLVVDIEMELLLELEEIADRMKP